MPDMRPGSPGPGVDRRLHVSALRRGLGHLVAVHDAHWSRVPDWAMDGHMRTGLVVDALEMDFEVRGKAPDRIVWYTDLGSQFASSELKSCMDAVGGRVSAGQTGYAGTMRWRSRSGPRSRSSTSTGASMVYESVDEWIDGFCNRQRIHTAFGGLSPVEDAGPSHPKARSRLATCQQ